MENFGVCEGAPGDRTVLSISSPCKENSCRLLAHTGVRTLAFVVFSFLFFLIISSSSSSPSLFPLVKETLLFYSSTVVIIVLKKITRTGDLIHIAHLRFRRVCSIILSTDITVVAYINC